MKRFFLWAGLFAAGLVAGFGVAFLTCAHPANPASTFRTPDTEKLITLSAVIDGSDRFIFTQDHAWNEHVRWQAPQKVFFNGEPWLDLTAAPPQWTDLMKDRDLTKAKIFVRNGRDVIALESTSEGFDLFFSDTQTGAATYEVTISIPRK